jgi:hypothetical protein
MVMGLLFAAQIHINIHCCSRHNHNKSRYGFWEVELFFTIDAGHLLNKKFTKYKKINTLLILVFR